MSRILILKDKEGASADEFFKIMKRYAKKNNASCVLRHTKQASLNDLCRADVIFCIRGDTPYMYFLLKIAKRLKKTIIYFLDDALKDMPDDSFRYPRRKVWHIKCVKKGDVLLTTNPFIAEDYQNYIPNRRTVLIHTAVDEVVPYKIHNGMIKIVYAASEWHIHNYNKMIAPIIKELLDMNENKIEMYFVGFKPGEIEDKRIHYVPKMNLDAYNIFMKNTKFDIGLAPLEKNFFSERKYFNKFVEYSRYGICGIYSDTFPYRFVVKNEDNGILVSNEPRAWLNAIQHMIDDKDLRSKCIQNAQAHLLNEHSDEVIFKKLQLDIPEMKNIRMDFQSGNLIENIEMWIGRLVKYYPFVVMEKFYMVKYSIKKEGLKTAINRIVDKFS